MAKKDLKLLSGDFNDKNSKELKKMLGAIRRDMPLWMEVLSLEAEFKRNRYNFLLENGFTEAQALELVKANTFMF